MAGGGRKRGMPRRPARFAVLVITLAAAGSPSARVEPLDDATLAAYCQESARKIIDELRNQVGPDNGLSLTITGAPCDLLNYTQVDPEVVTLLAPNRPAPTPVTTVGHAGCVTGPGRPVVDTVLTSVSATTGLHEAIAYKYQPLSGGDAVLSSGSTVLEFLPGDLAPGGSYRWRARIDDVSAPFGDDPFLPSPADDDPGWSPWCEFTVSADAVDYRRLGDVSLEALTELGLRPDREYAINLSGHQQRLLRAGTDIGRTSSRMTLTGPRWTDLLVQLAESATNVEAVGIDNDDPSAVEGTAYRAAAEAISVKLGGPRHPRLG